MGLKAVVYRIKEAANILDIISEHVFLKKVGRHYVGLCPFHSDSKPSFTVSEEKQIFHCFGCGLGGDVITFYMHFHNLTFAEAVKELAHRYGIQIKGQDLSPEEKAKIAKKERLFSLNEKAQRFFMQMLWGAKVGERARKYLKERGLSVEVAKIFSLGYAPPSYDSLASHFKLAGLDLKEAEEAGLLLARKDGTFYDRFRDRVIFPIRNSSGKVVGFGGRVLETGDPKYLNSPETLIYHKGSILYGLWENREFIKKAGYGFIVEGYMDLLSLYEAGIKEVVATLGTALTPSHVRLLKGLSTKWYLVFDADQAGFSAAKRVIPIFFNEGLFPWVIKLPLGEDPDSFVRKHGPQAFWKEKDQALPIFEFLLSSLISEMPRGPEKRLAMLKELEAVFSSLKDPLVFELYVSKVAETFDLSVASIKKALKKRVWEERISIEKESPFERNIMEFLLFYPEFFQEFMKYGLEEIFSSPLYQKLYKELAKIVKEKGSFSFEDLSFSDSALQSLISEILLSPPAFEKESVSHVAEQIKICILRRRKDNRLKELIKAIKQAEQQGLEEEAQRLLREYQKLCVNF